MPQQSNVKYEEALLFNVQLLLLLQATNYDFI